MTSSVSLAAAQRFPALQAGEIDLLVSNSTYTLARDAGQGVSFTGIYCYDGQGFLVKRSGPKTIKDLHRANICFQSGSRDRSQALLAEPLRGADGRHLRSSRDPRRQRPARHGLRRLGPVHFQGTVRPGRAAGRRSICRHRALDAMVEAEEYGITSKNVDEMLKSGHPTIKSILGVTPGMGKALGGDEKWVYDIVKQVGNHGESYDRKLGDGSPLRIPRSLNALWTKAGILYVPPIR